MASARSVLEKLKSSDGRVRIATLSGVSALVAVIALVVGVLPAIADHDESLVEPVVVDIGGGSGACSATIEGRLPSVARNEFHINNPTPGVHTDGIIEVTVYDLDEGRVFDFAVLDEGFAVYDVVVNGGPKSNHYDYDGNGGPGAVPSADKLHAPRKNADMLHNLSHINICYDFNTTFECGVTEELSQEGVFTLATVTIFVNSLHECEDKLGAFVVDNSAEDPNVKIDFGTGEGVVAGRATYTKDFGDPGDFVDLQYDGPGEFVDLQWCSIRAKDVTGGDGDEFDDVLASDEYPSLVGVFDEDAATTQATACKVFEGENAAGIQFTVGYFEFEDPQFK